MGVRDVSASTETVGASTNDQGYWQSFSSVYSLAGDGIINLKFKTTNNGSGTHYHTYTLVVNDGSAVGGTEYFRMMDMHFVSNSTYNSNANADVFVLTKNHTMTDAELQAALNGASVDMTITRTKGNIAVSATITPVNGVSSFTSTFNYLVGDATSDNFGAFLTVENAYVYDLFAVTTKNYDFTSWATESTTITLSETKFNQAYRQDMYAPAVYNGANNFNGVFGFRYATGTLSSSGLTLPIDNFLSLNNISAGDKVAFNYTGTMKHIHNRSGNYPDYSDATTDGTEISGANSVNVISGTTYFDYRDGRMAVRPNGNVTITSISVNHNTSGSYATLFNLWKTCAFEYSSSSVASDAEKTVFQTAINSAKTVLSNSAAMEDDYVDAIDALTDAQTVFTACETRNNIYAVASTSVMTDGTNVKSVYGITMTYRGTWAFDTQRGNAAKATEFPTEFNANHAPTSGNYWEFIPTMNGQIEIMAAWYSKQVYNLVDGTTGENMQFYNSSSSNIYSTYKTFGTLTAGHTYYLYKSFAIGNGYQINGFRFTPGDSFTYDSYNVASTDVIKGGDVITNVDGITMTFGGTSDDTWTAQMYDVSNRRGIGAYNTAFATLTGNTPTSGTYVIFNPTKDGILTVKSVAYTGKQTSNKGYVRLTDGMNTETVDQTVNSYSFNTQSFSTILASGSTYYVYFTGGNVNSTVTGFSGFTFTPTPSSVSATIGSTGFATFSSKYPLDLSGSTTKAYTASLTGETGSKTVLLTPITAVPANTGILLKGAMEEIPVKAGFVTAPATNLFKASADEAIAASVEGTYHYVLANGSNGVGFYNLAEAKNIGVGKAYLETTEELATDSEGARVALRFADEEATGISNVEHSLVNVENIYNLNGQRINKPAKGLYIVNGKKIIVK